MKGGRKGSLLKHMEAFSKYYLETEIGAEIVAGMGQEEASSLKEDCEYTRDELLPFFKYYCNFSAIEEALEEEQNISEKIPIVTDQQEARGKYQRDLAAFIEESRRVLSQGGTLPKMPDFRDYEETKEKKAYQEQVMQEIEADTKQYGMTVEEYAKNGYEPKVNPGREAVNRR